MKNWRQIWDPKNPKIKRSQNQNPFCPKCRRDFFMPEKGVPAPFGALPAHFFRRPEKSKNCSNFAYFPWWAHGPYSPGVGPLLSSTLGGEIGRSCMWRRVREGVNNRATGWPRAMPCHVMASVPCQALPETCQQHPCHAMT